MNRYVYNNELKHHGILGQKWGVRRFQNPDGSLTAAGRKRYASDDTSSKSNDAKASKWNNAASASKQFLKDHKKEIAIGAAVVGTALAIYGGYKFHQFYTMPADHFGVDTYGTNELLSKTLSTYRDKAVTLPKGTEFSRISQDAVADYTNTGSAYVAYQFRDKQWYKAGSEKFINGARNFIHTFKAKQEVNVPSARDMAKIYLDQHPNATDQQFRYMLSYGFVQRGAEANADPFIAAYKKQASDYSKEVLKRGYNAIVDLEDANQEVAHPLILLNPNAYNVSSAKLHTYEKVIANVTKRHVLK